jgi:hypothetical protein
MKGKHIFLLLTAACAINGCSSTSSQRASDKPPPKADRVQVLMYDTAPRPKTDHLDFCGPNPPLRPHKIIALLTCEGAVDQEAVMTTAIYYRARQMGADAVINAGTITTQRETTVNVAQTVEAQLAMNILGMGGSQARSVFRAYAIVYTNPTENDIKATASLVGHWKSVAVQGASHGVSSVELILSPDNRLVATTVSTNAPIQILTGRFFVQDGRIGMAGEKDPTPELADFSLAACRT